jgi:hypothetical protein
MDLDALAPVALGAGLARRPAAALERTDTRPVAPPAAPPHPSEVLAMLMDFSGSVALAELLHAPPSTTPAPPDAGRRARALHDEVRARLDTILPVVLRPLNGVRAPRSPGPEKLFETIVRVSGGPGRAPAPQAVAGLARELGAPLRAALAASVRQARVQVAGMRADIAAPLQQLGPMADRLERIDAALSRSIEAKLTRLFERMEHTAELSFERALAQACAALPPEFGAADLVGWAADSGFIEHHRSRCEHVTLALFGHLRRGLEGLLLAIEAEAV